jgi:hypothetical protein
MAACVASEPTMDIAENDDGQYPVVRRLVFCILVKALAREISRWWLPLCKLHREKSVIIGEIVLGEQEIDGLSQWVCVMGVTVKVIDDLVIILDAIDPYIRDWIGTWWWTSACCHALIVLGEKEGKHYKDDSCKCESC